MFADSARLTHGAEFDVCVIGAGAAGITLGCALDGSRHRVCILESGGEEFDPRQQQLYRGSRIGLRYPPLENGRLRYFGGTTNHWAGWCRPPRAADFRHRPWIPNSGWPLDADELASYLDTAARICDLGPGGFDPDAWVDHTNAFFDLDPALFETRCTRFSPPTRFASKYRDQLARSGNVEVHLGVNVTRLVEHDGREGLNRIEYVAADGTRSAVRAQYYVLATGGIENARLLLAGAGPSRMGVGNDRDQVGRWFMDHFKYHIGVLKLPAGRGLDFYRRHSVRGEPVMGVLGFTEDALARFRISPGHFEFLPGGDVANRTHRVSLRIDPVPNPASRIRLDGEVDRNGVPRVLLEFGYAAQDTRTLTTAVNLFASAADALGARFRPADGLTGNSIGTIEPIVNGFHHMGATRMSENPGTGVVDRHCRVHSVPNLFIAGCSVFPSYEGYPTMTLVALAQRLGDHLAELLS